MSHEQHAILWTSHKDADQFLSTIKNILVPNSLNRCMLLNEANPSHDDSRSVSEMRG